MPVFMHSPLESAQFDRVTNRTYDPERDETAVFVLGQSKCDGVIYVLRFTKAFSYR